MTGVQVASTLDCRGLACPLPVIKLSKAIKGLPVGAAIEMLATDPGAVADLEAYQKQTGHRLLEWSESNGVFRFLVQRAK
ncbi:MAG: sulfurtransferase TusA family protein [Candidatus Rokubacteria bacterium]|nr:sulfurtransferase TusA family protein [Candidatus Rokubacteria bacterium]